MSPIDRFLKGTSPKFCRAFPGKGSISARIKHIYFGRGKAARLSGRPVLRYPQLVAWMAVSGFEAHVLEGKPPPNRPSKGSKQ